MILINNALLLDSILKIPFFRKSMNNAKQYKNRDKAAMMEQQWKKRCDKREKKRSSDCQVDGMSFVSISC